MDPLKVQETIQEQSAKCAAEFEKHKSDFQDAVGGFLSSHHKRCLLVETTNTKIGGIQIMQALKQLKEDQENEKSWGRYLSAENQTFLHWEQLLDIAGTTEELPRFTNLLVCMFPNDESMKIENTEEEEVFHKIRDRLKIAVFKKIVFITSQGGVLDKYLKENDTMAVLKIDEFGNKVPSLILDEKQALIDKAYCGDVHGMAELLKNGADVNITTGQDRSTALHIATEMGRYGVALTLLRNSPEILPNLHGQTPLHIAAEKGHTAVVLALLEYDAEVNSKNDAGETALHITVENGHADVVLALLEYGAEVNSKNDEGETALHITVQNGHTDVVLALIEYGAEVNSKNDEGETALHITVENGHTDVVLALLEYGADVDIQNDEGETALHITAKNGDTDVVLALIRHGADVHIRNDAREKALSIAERNGHKNVVLALLENGAYVGVSAACTFSAALDYSIYTDDKYEVKILLDRGANINSQDNSGQMPLHLAASCNRTDIINMLLNYGADINAKDQWQYTALYFAAINNNFEVVKILIEKGANVHDTDGRMALKFAEEMGFNEVASLLKKTI